MLVHCRSQDGVDEIVERTIRKSGLARPFPIDAYLPVSCREHQLDLSAVLRISEQPRDRFVHRQTQIIEFVDIEAGLCTDRRGIEPAHFQITGSGGKPDCESIDLQHRIQSAAGESSSLRRPVRRAGVYSRQIESYRLHRGRIASTSRAGLHSAGLESIDRSLRLLTAALASEPPINDVAIVEVAGTRSDVRTVGRSRDVSHLSDMTRLAEHLIDEVDENNASELFGDAGIAVPIFAPDGHAVGAVVVSSQTRPSTNVCDLLHDAASMIELDIRLREVNRGFSAQLAAEQVEDELEASLASLAAATNRSVTMADVAQAVAVHGAAAIEASLISLATIESGSLRFVHGDGVHESVARNWIVSPADAPIPMAACIHRLQPVVLPDPESFNAWPVFRDEAVVLGLESFVALPIVNREGVALAAIGVGWDSPLETADIPVLVQRLASISAHAMERATEHESAQDHASALQSIVLPRRLPISEGLQIHGRYLPPTFGQRVGGDLFDSWVRDDGAVAFVVADVAGHTLEATRTAAALRHSIGMLSLEMRAPSAVLAAVDRYLQKTETSKLATCCYGVFDRRSETVTIANAGHPQPRLCGADGTVRAVGPSGELLLGFGSGEYSEMAMSFSRGSTLVMFTDGLIERRGVDFRVTERSLDRQLGELSGMSASEMSAFMLADVQGRREDDVVVMVVRRLEQQNDERDLVRSWDDGALELSEARAAIRSWVVAEDGLNEALLDDVLLVATELLSNAKTAARPGSTITLGCSAEGGRVEVAVTNAGPLFSHRPVMPAPGSQRGRGLAIVAAIADLSVDDNQADGITVRAVLNPPPH